MIILQSGNLPSVLKQPIGFLKGKSALAIARQFAGKERNFIGEHFGQEVMLFPL
jgi:hypothetical protein